MPSDYGPCEGCPYDGACRRFRDLHPAAAACLLQEVPAEVSQRWLQDSLREPGLEAF